MILFHLVWALLDLALGVALVLVGGAYIPSFSSRTTDGDSDKAENDEQRDRRPKMRTESPSVEEVKSVANLRSPIRRGVGSGRCANSP